MALDTVSHSPIRTPLHELRVDGRTIFVKDETRQIGGSFKYRGPSHFLSRETAGSTIVTASTGNHAIGVSNAARAHGLSARIHVPRTTPGAKRRAIAEAGGEAVEVPGTYEDALAAAEEDARASGATFLPSYDHPLIVAGNRTLFREAREDAGAPFERVYVPVGGGGCLSGAILEHEGTGTRIVACEYAPVSRVRRIALERRCDAIASDHVPEPSTEGIAIRTLGRLNRDIIAGCRALSIRSIGYDEIASACRFIHRRAGIVAELGACIGVASFQGRLGPRQHHDDEG